MFVQDIFRHDRHAHSHLYYFQDGIGGFGPDNGLGKHFFLVKSVIDQRLVLDDFVIGDERITASNLIFTRSCLFDNEIRDASQPTTRLHRWTKYCGQAGGQAYKICRS